MIALPNIFGGLDIDEFVASGNVRDTYERWQRLAVEKLHPEAALPPPPYFICDQVPPEREPKAEQPEAEAHDDIDLARIASFDRLVARLRSELPESLDVVERHPRRVAVVRASGDGAYGRIRREVGSLSARDDGTVAGSDGTGKLKLHVADFAFDATGGTRRDRGRGRRAAERGSPAARRLVADRLRRLPAREARRTRSRPRRGQVAVVCVS